jgi:hypothetical protein
MFHGKCIDQTTSPGEMATDNKLELLLPTMARRDRQSSAGGQRGR